MTYSMASLLKKTIRGKTYYYARECRRVDGKPKIVWQKYLGRADDIIAALTQPTSPLTTAPEKAVITEFGAVVALYDTARRLRLVEHLVRQVLFDATNFFTFIDTFNERCTLARRGKSKEGRAALRIIGLALLVTTDFHIPLCHHTYPGNQPDSPTFASVTEELVQRHRIL